MLKQLGPAFRITLVMTVLTGLIYPGVVTGLCQLLFHNQANGSLVYVNGCLVGRQPRGYSSFRYDITDVLNYGGENTVSVRVDASQFED